VFSNFVIFKYFNGSERKEMDKIAKMQLVEIPKSIAKGR
jgi:hypothetical protein